MKTKQEILTALAHSGDDKLLLAGLLDKEQTCEQRGYLTHTKFLDLKQRALCTDAVRLAGATGHALFWGGYEDAERGSICLSGLHGCRERKAVRAVGAAARPQAQ
ncbi:MAG: hypothetical protein ACLVB4_07885 [Butyricicoccus sp.]